MDEEVGKVAQAVPVIVSKALEMFMQSLIDETSKETRSRNAKKMSMAHLKRTICTVEQFDFLKEIVAKVPDSGPAEASPATPASAPATRTRQSKNASPAKAPRAAKASAAYPQHQSVFASASPSATASRNSTQTQNLAPATAPSLPYMNQSTTKKEEDEDDDYDMDEAAPVKGEYEPPLKRVKHELSPTSVGPKAHSMPKGPGGVNIFGDDEDVKSESAR